MNKIKVLFFCGSLNIGGTERNVINIVKYLDKEKFKVHIYCLYERGVLVDEVKLPGIKVTAGDLKSEAEYLRIYHQVHKIITTEKIDIVHSLGYPAIYFGTAIGVLSKVPVLISAIQDWDVWKNWKFLIWDKITRENLNLMISDGAGARRFAIKQQGITPSKIITLYDGVNLEELRSQSNLDTKKKEIGINPEKTTIGVVARLDDAKKGQSDFLRAVKLLKERYPTAQFLLIGGGADEGMLKNLARELDIINRVVFTGFRQDLADMIRILDIVVIPSRWESVPKILLEAMALAKPVIATNVGDISEILEDQKTGLLVPARNPQALARAIAYLLDNADIAKRLGMEANKKIMSAGLTIEKSVRRLEEIYQQTLDKAKKYHRPWCFNMLITVLLIIITLGFRIIPSIRAHLRVKRERRKRLLQSLKD